MASMQQQDRVDIRYAIPSPARLMDVDDDGEVFLFGRTRRHCADGDRSMFDRFALRKSGWTAFQVEAETIYLIGQHIYLWDVLHLLLQKPRRN